MSTEPTPGDRLQRNVVGALMVIAGVLSVVYLQGTFDQSDRRKSIEMVRKYQSEPGTATLGSWLAEETGGAPAYQAEITSGCEGAVQVAVRTKDGQEMRFAVDLVGSRVAPANEAADRAFTAFEASLEGGEMGTTPPT